MLLIEEAVEQKRPLSVGLLGNAAEILPELVRRNIRPDIVTDQTSAHDVVNGYLPAGWMVSGWEGKRISDPKAVEKAARASIATHVSAMRDWWRMGVPVVDYGNTISMVRSEERRVGTVCVSEVRYRVG